MSTIAQKQTTVNTTLVLIEIAGKGGGKFYSPRYYGVAEIAEGSIYTKSDAKNVIKVHNWFEYNYYAGKGANSTKAKQEKKAQALFDSIN
ncbi:hypothetical protein ACLSSQ_09365 [Azospira sp. APE16]|uniref:hypothetical protein n=1 Tax=Azospira sp. APE16 TaxID=3394231 RepID=UPI003A4DA161